MREFTQVDYSTLVGQDYEKVKETLSKSGMLYRLCSKDGEAYFGTCDVVPHRANLAVANGKVVSITFG